MRLANAKIHFIGIGGIGMCGLAEVLHSMKIMVTGSDIAENAQTQRLREIGISIAIGHNPKNVINSDVVVFSSAVQTNNTEYSEARRRKIPLIPRAEALAELMRLKRGIAIAGTHGKTTTTSLVASIFLDAKKDPTIIVGGRLDAIKSTALLGQSDWLIAEADESDGSFVKLSPEIVVITNIDNDHLDHYGSFDILKKAFYDFASRIPFYGLLVACGDDPVVRETFKNFPKRILFYGFQSHNDFILSGSKEHYGITCHDRTFGHLSIHLPGRHNALNALAALIVANEAGLSFGVSADAIKNFNGVDRRFHFKGEAKDILVYDDYGHHPSEIRAVLDAFYEKYPNRRLVVVFQPHRYSRTELCWNDFITCFQKSHKLYLLDIYGAGEKPKEGIDSITLASQIKNVPCNYIGSIDTADQYLIKDLGPGDILLTLGAGSGWKIGMKILEMLNIDK